jgi:DNA-binding GntR family transcriptional regulator
MVFLAVLSKIEFRRRRSARLDVADAVEEAILSGYLLPGQEIPQLELARRLKLSQSAVREALQELEHRGLVVRRGRTRQVIRFTEDELAAIYQVRVVLEPLACRLAACHWDAAADRQLEDCYLRMSQYAEQRDYRAHARADIEFHRVIWKQQPNRFLQRHLEMLCMPLWAFDLVERAPSAYLDFERSLRQHRTIMAALRTRNGERAERIVRRLIERFHRQDIEDFRAVEASQPAAHTPLVNA